MRLLLITAVAVLALACHPSRHIAHADAGYTAVDTAAGKAGDPAQTDLIAPYKVQLDSQMNEVVAMLGTELTKRKPEGTMGNWTADALLHWLQRESYAPVAVNWGVNNRSVSLRVPAGPPASRHVEHRFCGADVNLYIAAATVLAAAAHGIERRLDPGAPVTGNGYAAAAVDPAPSAERPAALPATWHESLERARGSAFLREALGEDFLKVFLAIKQQELARFEAEVTETDRAWYLDKL